MAKALVYEENAGIRTVLYDTDPAKSDLLATRAIGGVTFQLFRGKTGTPVIRYFIYSDRGIPGGKGFQFISLSQAVEFYGDEQATQHKTPANAFAPTPTVEA